MDNEARNAVATVCAELRYYGWVLDTYREILDNASAPRTPSPKPKAVRGTPLVGSSPSRVPLTASPLPADPPLQADDGPVHFTLEDENEDEETWLVDSAGSAAIEMASLKGADMNFESHALPSTGSFDFRDTASLVFTSTAFASSDGEEEPAIHSRDAVRGSYRGDSSSALDLGPDSPSSFSGIPRHRRARSLNDLRLDEFDHTGLLECDAATPLGSEAAAERRLTEALAAGDLDAAEAEEVDATHIGHRFACTLKLDEELDEQLGSALDQGHVDSVGWMARLLAVYDAYCSPQRGSRRGEPLAGLPHEAADLPQRRLHLSGLLRMLREAGLLRGSEDGESSAEDDDEEDDAHWELAAEVLFQKAVLPGKRTLLFESFLGVISLFADVSGIPGEALVVRLGASPVTGVMLGTTAKGGRGRSHREMVPNVVSTHLPALEGFSDSSRLPPLLSQQVEKQVPDGLGAPSEEGSHEEAGPGAEGSGPAQSVQRRSTVRFNLPDSTGAVAQQPEGQQQQPREEEKRGGGTEESPATQEATVLDEPMKETPSEEESTEKDFVLHFGMGDPRTEEEPAEEFEEESLFTGEEAGEEAREKAGEEAGEEAEEEAGEKAGEEAGEEAGAEAGEEAGAEAGAEAGEEAGEEAGAGRAGPVGDAAERAEASNHGRPRPRLGSAIAKGSFYTAAKMVVNALSLSRAFGEALRGGDRGDAAQVANLRGAVSNSNPIGVTGR
ncbi:hypothetical protein CYMTET_35126 [Cymbomonas tetramitiformis]|uniref:Uncharacterized protein n=1 Tax=Cymbomonas tetramitiformis TaxID=36881 RepID=A0AAE0F9X3_9CHLO|nr:hypothetical protein CYMTET_35126 [Cymbomonas tetramitiformis]